jgi:hypothetical protein
MAWGPAYFVLVDDDGWQPFWDGAFGEYLFGRLLGGPDMFLAYLNSNEDYLHSFLPAASEEEFIALEDTVDGGAVMDLVNRQLRWFGMPNAYWSTSPAYRRGYSRLLAEMWPGWRIRWAYRGAEELVDHIGLDRSLVVRKHERWRQRELRAADPEYVWLDGTGPLPANESAPYDLLTVRGPDGSTRVWAFDHGFRAAHLAWLGEDLLDRLDELPGAVPPRAGHPAGPTPGATPSPIRMSAPSTGLHVDTAGRWIGVWSASWVADLLDELPRLWPGWQVALWNDRYEQHGAAVADAIELSPCDLGAMVRGDGHVDGWHLFDNPPLDGSWLDPGVVALAEGRLAVAVARIKHEHGATATRVVS